VGDIDSSFNSSGGYFHISGDYSPSITSMNFFVFSDVGGSMFSSSDESSEESPSLSSLSLT